MADDASLAALKSKRYQYAQLKAAKEADLATLVDAVDAAEASIAAYETYIDALDAALADIHARPTLTSLSSYAVDRGAGALTLSVVGTGFATGATQIRVNGSAKTTTVASATAASCSVVDTYFETTGTLTIDIINSAPGGGVSATQALQVVNGDPDITALDPATVTAGAADTLLTVTGTALYDDSEVLLNGVAVVTELVGDDLTCTVPAASMATAGVHVSVAVRNPAPGGGQASPLVLTVA